MAENDSSLVVSGAFTAPAGGLYTLTSSNMSYTESSGSPVTPGNVLYRVITPPAHGAFLLSGSPTSYFTQQDVISGLVQYQHDGSAPAADTFRVWAVVTEVPGVVKPYTPNFDIAFVSPPPTTQGGFLAGVLLLGATEPPKVDSTWRQAGHSFSSRGVLDVPAFYTTRPNQVVFVMAYTAGSKTALPYPAAVPVASITYPGLTFTRLGGGSFNTISASPYVAGGASRYITTTADIYYAIAPSTLSSATLNITWTVTGPSGPELCGCSVFSYGDLADLAHPWGTDPASVAMHVTNTLPGSVTLNTSVDDQLVRPVLFEVYTSTDYDAPGGSGSLVGDGLMGYGTLGFGLSSGGSIGSCGGHPQYRSATDYADIPITITGTVEPPDPALRLAMDDVMAVIDADLSQNLVSLRWSDDGGHSYGHAVSQSIGEIGEYLTSPQWQRLGMCRDRNFEIFWSVPMPTALLGAWIEVTPAES